MELTPEAYAQTNTEHAQQVALFMWSAQNQEQYPFLQDMFAIPNGGFRSRRTATRLKAEGVKAGVPDIMLPLPKRFRDWLYCGLFIELKKARVGKQKADKRSDEQIIRMSRMQKNGYCCQTAYGFEEARNVLLQYIALPDFNQHYIGNR